MTDKTPTTVDPFAALYDDVEMCSCGTCRAAVDEALADFQRDLQGGKCPAWWIAKLATQVALLHIAIDGTGGGGALNARFSYLAEKLTDDSSLEYLLAQYNAIVSAPAKPN